MSQSEKAYLLFAISDTHLAHQIIQKVRQRFAQVPLDFDVVSDGRMAWSEFARKGHPLVVVSSDLPVMDGFHLIREIRKVNGATSILFLCPPDVQAPEGVDAISVPIVDWLEFLGRFQSTLPDNIKSRYGLFERNSILVQKLLDYGQRYSKQAQGADAVIKGSLAVIPRVFQSQEVIIKKVNQQSLQTTGILVYQRLSQDQQKNVLKVELGVLGVLTFVWSLVHLWKFEFLSELMTNLKGPLFAIMALAYLGFFLGRAFDRFIFSKKDSVENESTGSGS